MIDEQLQEKKKRIRSFQKPIDAVPAFLVKTYEILENPLYEHIIGWNEDGTTFVVKNVKEFSELILPRFFKHSNFASFVRQLNMYDFHKIRLDCNDNEFKHKMFRKGAKHLLSQIRRKCGDQYSLSLIKSSDTLNMNNFSELITEMANLANKQAELEKLIKIIIKQNEKFQKENKYLWNELLKNKQQIQNDNQIRQKNEVNCDKLILWFLQAINADGSNQLYQNNNNKSKLLMIKHNDKQKSNLIKLNEETDTVCKQESLEKALEGLSKKELISSLFQIFGLTQSKRQSIFDDATSESSEEFEEPKIFKQRKEIEQIEPMFTEKNIENQLMVYQNPILKGNNLEDKQNLKQQIENIDLINSQPNNPQTNDGELKLINFDDQFSENFLNFQENFYPDIPSPQKDAQFDLQGL